MSEQSQLLTIKQACEFLGLSKNTLERIREELPPVRVRGRVLYRRADLTDFIEKLEPPRKPKPPEPPKEPKCPCH